MREYTVFIRSLHPPPSSLDLFQTAISLSTKLLKNTAVTYSYPDKAFAVGNEFFYQVHPCIWFSHGLLIRINVNETDAKIQILLHSSRVVSSGAVVEIYDNNRERIQRLCSQPNFPPEAQGIYCTIQFSRLFDIPRAVFN